MIDVRKELRYQFVIKSVLNDGILIRGVATDETPDCENEIIDYDSAKAAFQEWEKVGNVRVMHQLVAAGVTRKVEYDDEARRITVEVFISSGNPEAIKLVQAGVLKYFSIGARYDWDRKAIPITLPGGEIVWRVFLKSMFELSIVDIGCNPGTPFEILKAWHLQKGGTNMFELTKELWEGLVTRTGDLEKTLNLLKESGEVVLKTQGVHSKSIEELVGCKKCVEETGAKVTEMEKHATSLKEKTEGVEKTLAELQKSVTVITELSKTISDLKTEVEALKSHIKEPGTTVNNSLTIDALIPALQKVGGNEEIIKFATAILASSKKKGA